MREFKQRRLGKSRVLGLSLTGLSLALFALAGIAGGGGGPHGSIGWNTGSPSSPTDEVIEAEGPLSISTGWSGGVGLIACATDGGFYYTMSSITIGPGSWSGSMSGVAENDYSVIALLNISNDSDPTQTENINSPVAALQVKGKEKTPQGKIVWAGGGPKAKDGVISGNGGTLGQDADWQWAGNKVTMYAFTTGQGFYFSSGDATLDKNGFWSAQISVPKTKGVEYTITVLGLLNNKKSGKAEGDNAAVFTKKME